MNGLNSFPDKIEGISYFDGTPLELELEGGFIKKITPVEKLTEEKEPYYIGPGLIDIQVNGFLSVSFSLEGVGDSSADGSQLSPADVRKVTEGLWKEGVTTYFPTLTTNSQDLLKNNFGIIAEAMKDPSLLGSMAGFHLEGPYISPLEGFRGAHPKEWIRNPDWEEFFELYQASGEKIVIVTLAPEVEGAAAMIKKCREKGIVVSLGHHNGTADKIRDAIDSGAELATHLGNGCNSMINRHHNHLWPQLADDRLVASIIADGFHLPPEIIQVIYKVKGVDKIVITSDVTSYAGMPAGEYTIKSGEKIVKTPEGNLRFMSFEGGLYGSATPLKNGIGHMMKVTGCSLAEAVGMATANPAGISKQNDRGFLEPGKRADIILFTMKDFHMEIKKTIVAGKVVYQA